MLKKKKLFMLILVLVIAAVAATLLLTGVFTPKFGSGKTINVAKYINNGAGDASDDTEAIQEAVDSAEKGDAIYFPNGTYNISKIDITSSGISLTGQSEAGVILKFAGDEKVPFMIGINGVEGVTVSKLTLTAAGNINVRSGIEAEASKELLISHVTVKDFALDTGDEDDFGPHGIHFTGADNNKSGVIKSEITDCTISNIGVNSEWGAGIRISYGSSRNRILRNTLSDFGRGGILCDNGSTNLVISNNNITGTGLWDDPDEEGLYNGEALGVEIFGGCMSAVVEDNIVDHWISIAADSHFSAVRRNTVKTSEGRAYSWCQLELAESGYSVFTNNDVGSGAQTGISMSNFAGDTPVEYGYFAYNTIKDPALFAVNLDGEGDSIRNIYFYKNDILGSKADHPASEAPGSGGVGMYLNGADSITFDSCKFDGHERQGVRVKPSTADSDGPPDVDHIRFVNSSITNSGKAFVFWDTQPISQYRNYKAFEAENFTVTKNEDNTIPVEKSSDNKAPIAIINAPSTGVVGEHLQFSSASNDPDGSIKAVLWDFDAGIPQISFRPVYAYNKAGTYRITLVVWDNEGNASRVEKTIKITDDKGKADLHKERLLTENPKPVAEQPMDGDNLALNKPVIASEGIEEGCIPEMAVNGSTGYPEWGPTGAGDKWLAVDLGEETTVSRYVIYHISNAGDPMSMNTKDFKIQKSSDGNVWTDVDVVNGNKDAITDKTLEPFQARYVKLVIMTPAQTPDETQGRILEFKLFDETKKPDEAAAVEETIELAYPKAFEKIAEPWRGSQEQITRAEFYALMAETLELTDMDTKAYDDIGEPDAMITRADAAVILVEAYFYSAKGGVQELDASSELKFSDGDAIEESAGKSASFACLTGLMDMEAGSAFNPKGNITKAGAVLMAEMLYKKFIAEGIVF